jgi:hypothetical protein
MDPKERARKLVALATDQGASSEEARSAAMAAVRLIVKHKLLDGGADHGQGAARRRSSPGRSPAQENGHGRHDGPGRGDGPVDPGVDYRAARRGTCAFCTRPYGPEDEVMVDPEGFVDHWHCAKQRAAGRTHP